MSVLREVKKAAADNASRTLLAACLRVTGGNISEVARCLRVDVANVRREIRRLGLKASTGTEG